MHLSVAICTWNRAALLDQTLTAMRKLEVHEGITWELLIVNNNCTDDTDNVIAKHQAHLPIRRLFEPRPGKSFALNHASREAHGEYILWTDDDVLVDEKWIVAYSEAFTRWPNASIFGGPAKPWFAGSPPVWLEGVLYRVSTAYACRDLGDEPFQLSQELVPYGLNMAVRTYEQRRYLYDGKLGPRPNSSLRGEETTVVRRMLGEGAEGWWVPTARVLHIIPGERQTTRYLRSFFFGYGEYLGRTATTPQGLKLFGKPGWMWREAIEWELKYRIRRMASSPRVWIEDLIKSSTAWGQLWGWQR